FALEAGRSLALLGRNGTGKTTLLNTLIGVTRRHGGTIALAGRDITALPAHARAAAGIGWVPQERNIFKSLSVDENLTAVARPGPWTPRRVYEMFPRLEERKGNLGNQLSGGEQRAERRRDRHPEHVPDGDERQRHLVAVDSVGGGGDAARERTGGRAGGRELRRRQLAQGDEQRGQDRQRQQRDQGDARQRAV